MAALPRTMAAGIDGRQDMGTLIDAKQLDRSPADAARNIRAALTRLVFGWAADNMSGAHNAKRMA